MSKPPYDSLNLAHHVGDSPDAVAANREHVARAHGLAPAGRWAWLDQEHGAVVHVVDRMPSSRGAPIRADAAVTALPGAPLVVLTADCAPVAIADDLAVGVVHAGWRGLLRGVVAAALDALGRAGGGPVRALIGPTIRPASYEFGRGDLDRVVGRFGSSVEGRTADGRAALDLVAGVRAAFAELGVDEVVDVGDDTAAEPRRWFSYRRDGTTGRQALVVVKEPGWSR